MNFLLDVNASGIVARWLIQLGHDVAEVGQKDPRMSDNEILSWAVRERRIIITTEPIAKVLKREEFVIPTKVGIQFFQHVAKISGFPFARE